MNIKLRVRNLIAKTGTSDPYQIAKFLGITVRLLELPPNVRGFCVRSLKRRFIVINQLLNEDRQRIVLCHELGHVRLHPTYGYCLENSRTCFVSSKREYEATEFAIHLLSNGHDYDGSELCQIISAYKPDSLTIHAILLELTSIL